MASPQVWFVLGTRPEVIKLAPVLAAFRRQGGARSKLVVTGQHREMLAQTLGIFGLKPDLDLRLMRRGQHLNDFNARAIARLGALYRRERPDVVVVQGDTSTAMAAALAAFHEKIPVAHVEAGLRSFDLGNPFPEEFNRRVIDSLSALHFAPTKEAARNLRSDGIAGSSITVTGNTVIDALDWAQAKARAPRLPALARALGDIPAGAAVALVTTHRRESFGAPLEGMCAAFARLLKDHSSLHLLYPLHPNPSAGAVVRRLIKHPRAHLLPALDYLDMTAAMRRCDFLMTDAGGLQEEASRWGKPVLVLRRVTERPEMVTARIARVAGTDARSVYALADRLLRDKKLYRSMAKKKSLYGDGRAGERIAKALLGYLRSAM